MKQPSHEIVEKAKELAKYWRMDIYKGCWYSDGVGFFLYVGGLKDRTHIATLKMHNIYFPIPDISDCEQKLLEIGHTYRIDRLIVSSNVQLYSKEDELSPMGELHGGKNTHLALLLALIEVMKEGK